MNAVLHFRRLSIFRTAASTLRETIGYPVKQVLEEQTISENLIYNPYMPITRSLPDNKRWITYLELKNFRAFEQQTIRFAPLTILVGPNNAGKSSILSAIRLLAQTLQSGDWDVPLLLGEFGTYKDIIHGNNSKRLLGLTVGFSHRDTEGYLEATFKYRAQRREINLRDLGVFDHEHGTLLKTQYSKDSGRQVVREIRGITKETTRQLTRPIRMFHFLPRLFPVRVELDRLKKQKKISFPSVKALYEVDRLSRSAASVLQSVQYLGPFREHPERIYPFAGERPSILGITGSGATDMIVADFFRRGTRKQKLTSSVRSWLAKANVATNLLVHMT